MDLFGDLPPPSCKSKTSDLYDDIPTKDEKPNLKRESEDKAPPTVDTKKTKSDAGDDSEDRDTFCFESHITERKGERDDMQDAASLMDDCTGDFKFSECGTKILKAAFFGVFDGHGGAKASSFAKEHLYGSMLKNFPKETVENFDRELKKSLIRAFKETDEDFLTQARKETPPWKDGSTATCILCINNVLYGSNIGDSKAVLVREKPDSKKQIIPLTKEHSPTDYHERQRIQNAGGVVRDGRVQGILEVSRAFGDARFKKYVIATPDIFKATLTDSDRYLLIACDGLWKAFKVADAVQFIDDILNDTSTSDLKERYEKACKEIANESVRRCSGDNVTVVLVQITKV